MDEDDPDFEKAANGESRVASYCESSAKTQPAEVNLLERRVLRVLLWAGFASLACTALTIIYLVFPGLSSRTSAQAPSGALEFVSPYIGLDIAIHHDTSPLPPIVNYPILLAQVNAAQPHEVLLDTHRWNSSFGMIYPADRTFKVAPGISTIAQFRAIDWGMERCTVNVVLPELSDMMDFMNFTVSGSTVDDPEAVMLEMWRVSSPQITQAIDPRTLSWQTRPQRKLLVGYWTLKSGMSMESEVFECASNSLHTFEFACVGSKCYLEFQQDPNDPRIGFYITQRQSKQ
ncbi:hypothetical protein MSAN_01357300 [Mycena sanguinolenta]|uniref:Ubiquitin 3 binding protein But2 C-terminal domain-containing protein n=1 Tax=Mycena sanguinolenta TaxID=230812 RepID=A0A8H7D0N4_9AGAR|nr:hypothetical protein MSAN_01357300 [Mycena sanguinolenta]